MYTNSNPNLNRSNIRVGIYLRIVTPEYTEYFYQNFSQENMIFESRSWSFIPIEFTPPARNLDLDNTTAKALLPNLPEILQAVEENDGFRDSIIETKCVFPDIPNSSPYALDLMVVRSSRVAGTSIEIEMQSPFSAIGANFPTVFWTTGTSASGLDIAGFVPEVPVVANVRLN